MTQKILYFLSFTSLHEKTKKKKQAQLTQRCSYNNILKTSIIVRVMNVKNMYSLEIQYVFKTSFELVHWNTNKQTNKQINKQTKTKISK